MQGFGSQNPFEKEPLKDSQTRYLEDENLNKISRAFQALTPLKNAQRIMYFSKVFSLFSGFLFFGSL
jgi:hypothetical protein